MRYRLFRSCCVLFVLCRPPLLQAADEDGFDGVADTEKDTPLDKALEEFPTTRIYQTREEQREAGLKREITPWLTLSGLAEAELSYDDFDSKQGRAESSGRDDSATLQLGLILSPLDFAEAEIMLEYDTDKDKIEADEAYISIDAEPWELALGKQYTPFGVYFSNFVSGPLVEFGETQADEVATLTFGPGDDLALLATVYRGRARKRGKNSGHWNWALALAHWVNRNWSLGLSYQSDLADADSRPLQDENDRYSKRVSGVSGYLLWVGESYEATLEFLAATGSFEELDRDRNQPWAWNMELVHFVPGTNFELAFRVEGSRELEDEPGLQFGPAVTWRIGKHASLTLEYLHGEFKDGLATNDEDEPYDHVDHIGGQLTIEF